VSSQSVQVLRKQVHKSENPLAIQLEGEGSTFPNVSLLILSLSQQKNRAWIAQKPDAYLVACRVTT